MAKTAGHRARATLHAQRLTIFKDELERLLADSGATDPREALEFLFAMVEVPDELRERVGLTRRRAR